MFRFNKMMVVLAVAGLLVVAVTAQSAVFDLAADFSTAANPNSAWSYGWKDGAGNWNAYTTSRVATTAENYGYWYAGSLANQVQNRDAQLYKNGDGLMAPTQPFGNPDVAQGQPVYFDAGQVVAYVGQFPPNGAIWTGGRWTSTVAGDVTVAVSFKMQCDISPGWGGHGGPDTSKWHPMDVSIVKNGTAVQSATLTGFAANALDTDNYGNPIFTWTGTIAGLSVGDTLDFGATYSGAGSTSSLPVGLSAQITTQDVPEPSGLLGLAMLASGMGLTTIRRIRRK